MTFEKKKRTVKGAIQLCCPFQASDFVAYEAAKANRMLLEKEDRGQGDGTIAARRSLLLIAPKGRDMYWRYIDKDLLREFVRSLQILRR